MENETLNEIIKLINSSFHEKKINSDDLENIVETCQNLTVQDPYSNSYQMLKNFIINHNKVIWTHKISQRVAIEFMKRYEQVFGVSRQYTIPVYKEILDDLFADGKKEIVIVLGEESGRINFSIEKSTGLCRIDKTNSFNCNSHSLQGNFERGFGREADQHLMNATGNRLNKNTRKFKLTRNAYDELISQNLDALLFFPVICTDSNPDSDGNSNLHQLTFLITFGKKSGQFPERPTVVFDRSSLCPPGNC